jgi:hypothetical protein
MSEPPSVLHSVLRDLCGLAVPNIRFQGDWNRGHSLARHVTQERKKGSLARLICVPLLLREDLHFSCG